MTEKVYILRGPSDWTDGDGDGIIYGVYRTKESARAAMEEEEKQDTDEYNDDTFAWIDERIVEE